MMAAWSGPHAATAQASERGAAFALLPIAATLLFYVLPASLQTHWLVQFTPQILAYLALGLWAARNRDIASRLGLKKEKITHGLRWGILTGLLLGSLNAFIILFVYPRRGYDISFLTATPHARIPLFIMVPWFICCIAFFVELNFRGFLLGRLAALESKFWKSDRAARLSPLALLTSALVFTFDPFMVNTFQHLHWIALGDSVIWGIIWLTTNNLYAVIVAHAVEVLVLYGALRAALMP